MQLNLHISDKAASNLNWAAQIAIENVANGITPSLEDIREMFVPFMLDDSGQPMSDGEARRLLGRIRASESEEAARLFVEKLNDFLSQRQNGKPPTSGSRPVKPRRSGSTRSSSPKSGVARRGKSKAAKRK